MAMGGTAIVTIVSSNYISFAATLMQSVREHHPDADRFIILSDAAATFPSIDLAAEMLQCDDLGIRNIANMKLWYSVIEFNTAVKPFALLHMLEERGYDRVMYIDPDILLFRELTEIEKALRTSSLALTPHMMSPLQDGKEPGDLTIMKSGVYNLGFVGVANDRDGRALLHWWADRLYAHCRVDIANHMFTDQRWMDLSPAFVERVAIIRHPGYNVAYWNLLERSVTQSAGGDWLVNGKDLAFFHFSGIKVDDPTTFSKHQNRYYPENLGEINELTTLYRERVLANDWLHTRRIEYAYGRFADGRPIEQPMRNWILRAVDDDVLNTDGPLAIDSDYFDQPDDAMAARGLKLTRFMAQLWLERPDLQRAFDLGTTAGDDGYFNWFCGPDALAEGVDGRSVHAARVLRGLDGDGGIRRELAAPPWPAASLSCWDGPAAQADRFLCGSIRYTAGRETFVVPRQIALAWEQRLDLQEHFDVTRPAGMLDLLTWSFTDGIRQGDVDPGLFDDAFLDWIGTRSSVSDRLGDVPLTRALIATRRIAVGRNETCGPWATFPMTEEARFAHAIWFCFVGARLFSWPKGFVEPVLAYLQHPSGISCGGFGINRAALHLWKVRKDVQAICPMDTPEGGTAFLHWLLKYGLDELGIALEDFDPRLHAALRADDGAYPTVPALAVMVWRDRADLREAFALDTTAGAARYRDWLESYFRTEYQGSFAALLDDAPPSPPLQVTRVPVLLTGVWSAVSGRGEDLRTTAQSLESVGFRDFMIFDLASGLLLTADGRPLDAATCVHAAINIVHANAETAARDWSLMRRSGVTADRVVGYWAWELERIPECWTFAFAFYDEIWASTEFAKAAFESADLRPVRLMRMAVVAHPDPNAGRDRFGIDPDALVFLFMFDIRSFVSRKNPAAAVRAFARAFPAGTENVRLFIKTHGAPEMPEYWSSLKAMTRDDPRVMLRDLSMSRPDVLKLLSVSDVFVSLHRSEGFGRGPAEAMALGKPVIATAYSGNVDFTTAETSYPVQYDLVPVRQGEYPGWQGQVWADVDIDSAAEMMRDIYLDPQRAREVAERGRQKILRDYSLTATGTAMIEALTALGAIRQTKEDRLVDHV